MSSPQTTEPDRWQRLNEVFAAALECEPDQQRELLLRICADDEDLRSEVEAILAATRSASGDGFLEGDVFAAGVRVIADNEIAPGAEIGPYRVVHEIGRGGMGAVYLAERDGFHQKVALKIIKRGMDTEAIVRRFVLERDVLASLNHPNIARLLDGGTTADGLPFIAMEYVEGEAITEFCDRKRLTIEGRLGLFRKVCAAVTYAHQNLVVHRDIKPSNILVGPDGEPKLLDFGIAKLLSPELFGNTIEPTATGANLMTPEYASPEQIRGEKITTASDIYSLGVLLYELLCGYRPFRFKNRLASEVIQIISERQPSSPSTAAATVEGIDSESKEVQVLSPVTAAELRSEKPEKLQRKLVGDLDNIVLMALRKEPLRRYASVLQFSEDIKRHLEGLPVIARPATFSYRATKFVERNRAATVFAVIAMFAILSGLSLAVWQAVMASRQSARAERRSNEVRRLTDVLLKDLDRDVAALPGSGPVNEKISKISIEYLKGLAQETNDPDVLRQLSVAYILLGKQHGYENRDPKEIRENISRGLEISRSLAARDPNDIESKKLLARNLEEYDYFCETQPVEKLRLTVERVELRKQIVAAAPEDAEGYDELAGAYGTLSYLSNLFRSQEEGQRYLRLSIEMREQQIQMLEKKALTPRERDLLSSAYSTVGSLYFSEFNNLTDAETNFKRAAVVAESLVAEHPDYRLAWTRMSAANRGLASVQYKRGDYQGALEHFSVCLRLVRESSAKLHDVQMQYAEPGYMLRVGENLYRTGNVDQGLQMIRDAFAVHARANIFTPTPSLKLIREAAFLRDRGDTYASLGRVHEALVEYRETESIWKRVREMDVTQAVAAELQFGLLCLKRGDLYSANHVLQNEARSQYQNAVEILSRLKATTGISLEDTRNLEQAQQKLRSLAG